jgi:hypothetical protein
MFLRSYGRAGLFLALAVPALAQQGAAEIQGRFTDESGGALRGVVIVLTNEDTGAVRQVTSGPDGSFSASQLSPGRYQMLATLERFQAVKRGGLILQAGQTLIVSPRMDLGPLPQTVTVTADPPFIDTTNAKVGGNIGPAELTLLPTINRSSFATVALLPGIQLVTTNQMGNDTVAAAGQTAANNNVTLGGGYNVDDAVGTGFGGQVRMPLEAIQELEVITSMYDAEFGRASGAVVNAITRSGTNRFTGVVFGYAGFNRLTSEDFFVKQQGLDKPSTKRRDWGGVIGGPIVRNLTHFFFSLERQVDAPNRTRIFPTRPSLNFSIAEDRTDWNTLIRSDHQITSNHAWNITWLRESAPQWNIVGANRQTLESAGDETDLDQLVVGTLTSVLGSSLVNTVRVARTWEHTWNSNTCWRAQGPEFPDRVVNQQAKCPPQLDYQSFLTQASVTAAGRWDSNYQIEDDFSWFLPGRVGAHNLKFGFRYNYTELKVVSQANQNGTFKFSTDTPFDPADPRTYPERLTIRTGQFDEFIKSHVFETFAQDKWMLRADTTLSLGLRYDLEIIPLDEMDNPLFPADSKKYPVDRNNIAPRIGVTHSLDEAGKSVIRAGYGIFYNRTLLGSVDDVLEFGKYTTSAVVTFPNDRADPGPSKGEFPGDPFLVNGPFLNRALLEQGYPPGVVEKNTGVIVFDSPNRKQPYAHQFTVGYAREVAPSLSIRADYVRILGKDMFLARNLNPAVRADTSRTGAVTRVNVFGVLGEPYSQQVWVMENNGETTYDALNLSIDKRYVHRWFWRVAYTLSSSRGTADNQADRDTYQVLDDLNLNLWRGPSVADRPHLLSAAAQAEIPKTGGVALATTIRYMSGVPFTIYNSGVDVNRNGELDDPVPPGTYSGTALNAMKNVAFDGSRNGARGPDYFQIDVRVGWHHAMERGRVFDVFADIFNVTNRANFDTPVVANRDVRLTSFLALTNLYGGGGFPRQALVGARYSF